MPQLSRQISSYTVQSLNSNLLTDNDDIFVSMFSFQTENGKAGNVEEINEERRRRKAKPSALCKQQSSSSSSGGR